MCGFGYMGSLIIANMRVQRSDKHQRVLDIVFQLILIRLDSHQAIEGKGTTAISQNLHGMQHIPYDQWFVDIQLKMSIHASKRNSNIVAHHLATYHCQRFTLSWVYFSRHDARARLILRQNQLCQTTSRSRSKQPDVIGNLVQTDSQSIKTTMQFDQSIMRGKSFEFVWSRFEMMACLFGNLISNHMIESLVSIESCPHSSPSLGDLQHIGQGPLDALNILLDHMPKSRKLLSKSDGRGILKMGSSYLVDMDEFMRFSLELISQLVQTRQQLLISFQCCSYVHDGGEAIVAGLTPIHVVVWMNQLISNLSSQDLNGPIGNHFIGIHVGLRA